MRGLELRDVSRHDDLTCHDGRWPCPNPVDIFGGGSAPDLRVPACSSIATLTSFEGANGGPFLASAAAARHRDVAEVHTAGCHSRLRSQRMMAFGTPYQHTSQAISPAPPLRQLAGKTMLLVLQLLRLKPHGGAGAMVLNVDCALHLLSGGPHSCQYTGRPLCKRS